MPRRKCTGNKLPREDKPSTQRDWANIGIDILMVIETKINSIYDYLSFSAVCKAWNAATVDNHDRRKIGNNINRPLLLHANEGANKRIAYINCGLDQNFHQLNLPREFSRRYCGSSHGWLIEFDSRNLVFFLVNPFTFQVVNVPILSFSDHDLLVPDTPYIILKAVLSADPSVFPNYTMGVIFDLDKKLAVFQGSNQKWDLVENEVFSGGMHDIIHYKDEFFAIDNYERLFTFTSADPKTFKCIFCPRTPPNLSESDGRLYLVESPEGELLKIFRSITVEHFNNVQRSTWFDIWKVKENGGRIIGWRLVEYLEKVSVFLGDSHSVAVMASDFPKCSENTIYFTFESIDENESAWTYGRGKPNWHLDTGRFTSRNGRTLFHLVQRDKPPAIWIVPTLKS